MLLALRCRIGDFRSSVAQWQSIRLLTEGLLVRVQPGEPLFRHHNKKVSFSVLETHESHLVRARGGFSGCLFFLYHLKIFVQVLLAFNGGSFYRRIYLSVGFFDHVVSRKYAVMVKTTFII